MNEWRDIIHTNGCNGAAMQTNKAWNIGDPINAEALRHTDGREALPGELLKCDGCGYPISLTLDADGTVEAISDTHWTASKTGHF